ncbi:hypothetical protein [Brevirhabdus sp.]|uniref:hypothetical protein n=1 Tax=Brevirhabdus sp. TaxID=2004514 RepID=UPI004059C925
MKIAFHLGAHDTDDDQLLKCLLRNIGPLSEQGIIVPGPSRYRPIIRETLKALGGAEATPDVTEVVLDSVMDVDDARRLILSNENFICVPQRVLTDGALYPNAGEKSRRLANIFPGYDIEFYLAIRDPATFVPANHRRMKGMPETEYLALFDPMALRWSDVVAQISEANPDARITVWCNEDTPLIWPEVLRAVAGHDEGLQLNGVNNLVQSLMTKDGSKRLEKYLAEHPPANPIQRRRVVAAFLEKFGMDDQLEEELDMPGWTEDYVAALTQLYEEDMHRIVRIPGVTLIAP